MPPARAMSSLRFVQEQPGALKTAHSWLFYRPGVLVGVAVGGLTASLVAMVYYFQSTGTLGRLLSGKDKIRFEKGLLVLDTRLADPSPHTAEVVHGIVSQAVNTGAIVPTTGVLSVPLPVLSFAFWALLTATTALLAYTKSRLDLHYRQFVGRVGFSLSIMDNGKLKLRTVGEEALNSLMMGNSAAARVILDAAKKTTVAWPILTLPPNESYVLMKAIFNQLSPISAQGFFLMDRSEPHLGQRASLALTWSFSICL